MGVLAPDTLLSNRYLISEKIGEGGMGAVYLARDKNLNIKVAVKQTFFREEYLRKAFRREAQLLASLNHPALPRVSDHFVEGEDQFLVMAYIEGNDLSKLLEQRGAPFEPAEVLRWAYLLLSVLEYLHMQGILHRDIKPQNLKLNSRGKIILLDFGLAKGTPSDATGLTTGVSLQGYTIHYASLEQIQGLVTDATADLFSLAATFYHLLTGKMPIHAMSRAAVMASGRPDPLRLASELHPHVPAPIAAVLMRAMSFNHEERPATAAAMQKALEDAANASAIRIEPPPVIVTPAPPAPPIEVDQPAAGQESGTQSYGSEPPIILQPPIVSPPPASPPPVPPHDTVLAEPLPPVPITVAEEAASISPKSPSTTLAAFARRFECVVECQDAWPLSAKRVLVLEKATGALSIRAGKSVVWRDPNPVRIRKVSRGPENQLAVAGWDGQVRCFADGQLKATAKLPGTVGDLQFGAERWLAGTWKHSLISIATTGTITPLLDVDMGVFRIGVMADSDWFAVADLSGGIAMYKGHQRVANIPSVGAISSLAFAGRKLVVMLGASLVTIELDGRVGPREPRPGNAHARLLTAYAPDRCLLLNDNGYSWSINESGAHLPDFTFIKGQTLLSHCKVPKRFTVAVSPTECAYWRDGQPQQVWKNAITAKLSADGRFIAVVFPDKVQLYEDPK